MPCLPSAYVLPNSGSTGATGGSLRVFLHAVYNHSWGGKEQRRTLPV